MAQIKADNFESMVKYTMGIANKIIQITILIIKILHKILILPKEYA